MPTKTKATSKKTLTGKAPAKKVVVETKEDELSKKEGAFVLLLKKSDNAPVKQDYESAHKLVDSKFKESISEHIVDMEVEHRRLQVQEMLEASAEITYLPKTDLADLQKMAINGIYDQPAAVEDEGFFSTSNILKASSFVLLCASVALLLNAVKKYKLSSLN